MSGFCDVNFRTFGVQGLGFSDVRGSFSDVRGLDVGGPILDVGFFWTFGVRGFIFGRSGFGRWGPLFGRWGFSDVRGWGFSDVRGWGFFYGRSGLGK